MNEAYDLLVIGGGINGAGIARDAAGRGIIDRTFEYTGPAPAARYARNRSQTTPTPIDYETPRPRGRTFHTTHMYRAGPGNSDVQRTPARK